MENKQPFLDAAAKIAYKICREAIWHNQRCNWVTAHVAETNGQPSTYFKSLDSDFYAGTSGIAYFLTAVYSAQPEPIFKETAIAAFEQAVSQAHKIGNNAKLGFHTGLTGIIYTALYLADVFKNEAYKQLALDKMTELFDLDLTTAGIDVIDGCAGALPTLIKIQQQYPSEKGHDFIIKMADHLIKIADKKAEGWSWNTLGTATKHLTGHAHGAAGIAAAFLELYHFTANQYYLDIAKNTFAYENQFYNHQHHNWPDFRDFSNYGQQQTSTEPSFACGWCHGAPGIGLSRLWAYELTEQEIYKKDALNAIANVLGNNTFNQIANFSLCHGLFGNADLLIYGSQLFNDTSLLEAAENIAEYGIKNFLEEDTIFPNGLNNPYYCPTLMLGEAGIGYYYLRLFDVAKFKSVLLIK